MKKKPSSNSAPPFSWKSLSDLYLSIGIAAALIVFLLLIPRINLFISLRTVSNADYIIEYYLEKNPEKAAAFAAKAAEKFPHNAIYLYRAGSLNYDYGDKNKAGEFLKKARRIFFRLHSRYASLLSDPLSETMAKAFVKSGEMELHHNSLHDTLIYLQYAHDVRSLFDEDISDLILNVIAEKNLSNEQKIDIATFYSDIGKTNAAEDLLKDIPEEMKNFYLAKARIAAAKGNKKKSHRYIRKEIKQFPDNLAAFLLDENTTETIQTRGFRPFITQDKPKRLEHVTTHKNNFYFYRSDGILDFEIDFQEDGANNSYYIQARGTPAGGIWPVMEITVNDEEPVRFYVNNNDWRAFPLKTALKKGPNTISIRFLNRGVYGAQYTSEGKKKKFREHRSLVFRNIWRK